MKDTKSSRQADEDGEFLDAADDFPFYDCSETLSDPIQYPAGLRRRTRRKPSSAGAPEPTEDNSSVESENHPNDRGKRMMLSRKVEAFEGKSEKLGSLGIERGSEVGVSETKGANDDGRSPITCANEEANSSVDYSNAREKRVMLSRKAKEFEGKLEKLGSLGSERGSECPEVGVSETKGENGDGHSSVTFANEEDLVKEEDLVSGESRERERDDLDSSFLLILAGLVLKSVGFQFSLLVKCVMLPIRLVYYSYVFVYDPFGILRSFRGVLVQKLKGIGNVVFGLVSESMRDWLKEHQSVWELGLKCSWGLLWSGYVCVVLVGLLLLAFVMGGMLTRVMVEEPIRMRRSLNFDYTEKSPVAFVPIMAQAELSHEIYVGKNPEIGKASGSRVIPPNHRLKASVLLTLPESEYNQNLGIFQIRVDFLSVDGKTVASSRRPCMLQYRSQPIRLLLTFLKVAPILTGYKSETQNLKITFRGFTEGDTPTACLRVVIEQRAEFSPGAGIPEIYAASATLESELPLPKKLLWFWKKTLFVWVSMSIFTMELFFALLCCKPFVIPRIRLRGAANRDASQNNRPRRS